MLYAFFHQNAFELGVIDFRVDFGQDVLRREPIDLASERQAALLRGVVGGGRVGLDVAAGQGLDVFPRRLARLLRACAGEDDLLAKREFL